MSEHDLKDGREEVDDNYSKSNFTTLDYLTQSAQWTWALLLQGVFVHTFKRNMRSGLQKPKENPVMMQPS